MKTSITIYRGTHQIGGCITELCCENTRIIIDFGANLPGCKVEENLTDEEIVKRVFPTDNSKPKCVAVLFTHYHGDHYGLFRMIPEELNIPMYIGQTAKKVLQIITKRTDFVKYKNAKENVVKDYDVVSNMKTYLLGRWMKLSEGISVMPLVVDHSALDAYMLYIKLGEKYILFTGDFRNHGIVSEHGTFEAMVKHYIGPVDVLITEGTMLSRVTEAKKNPIQTEDDLQKKAEEIFAQHNENVVLVSSTNLDSVMGFYHATPKDKAFVCDAYQAELILAAIEDKGKYYPKYRLDDIFGIPRNFYIVGPMGDLGRDKHCYPAKIDLMKQKGFVMLARQNKNPKIEKGRFEKIVDCMDNPYFVYSMWSGYLEGEHQDKSVVKFLEGHAYEPLHTSGHAYVETIANLIDMVQPGKIIPMHTECADEFGEMPELKQWCDRVTVLQDGMELEL